MTVSPNGSFSGLLVTCNQPFRYVDLIGPYGVVSQPEAEPGGWSAIGGVNDTIFATTTSPTPPFSPATFAARWDLPVATTDLSVLVSDTPDGRLPVVAWLSS